MKRYERRRKPYRGRKRTDQRSGYLLWHRMLAVLVAAVTFLTGVELSGLEAVFAKETSGYQIDVSYSEGKDQAVLKGNADNISAGVTLGELKDEEGNTFDPAEFEMAVTENGTYTYTLTYQETASQTGKQIDKEEEVSVTVDQIRVEAETSEISDVSAASEAEAAQQSSEQQPAETLPISVLQAELQSLQQTREVNTAQMTVSMYAEELQSIPLKNAEGESTTIFSGGTLDEEDVPSFQQRIENTDNTVERQFVTARVILDGVSELAGVQITGLYPVQNNQNTFDWYYTVDTSANVGAAEPAYGDVSVGYLLNSGDQVRFYYSSAGQEYEIQNLPGTTTINGSTFDFNFTLQANGKTYEGNGALTGSDRIKVRAGQKMIVEVDMSSSHKSSLLAVYKGGVEWDGDNPLTTEKVVSSYSLLRKGEMNNTELEDKAGNTLKGKGELENTTGNVQRYRVVLEMPAQNIAFRMHTFTWPTNELRSFALYINQGQESYHKTQVPASNYDGGGTRFFNTFVSIPSDTLNSGSANDALINGTGVNNANKMQSISYKAYTNMWEHGFGDYSAPTSGTAGAYTHIDLPNWPDSLTSLSGTRNFVRATGKGNLDGMDMSSVNANRQVYLAPGSSQKVTPAFGHFYVGEPVGFRLETSLIRKESNGTVHGQYLPSVLAIDIYSGEDGTDITSNNFERHEIDLSSVSANQTVSFDLQGSGRVLVKCLVKQEKNATTGWNGFGSFNYSSYGTNGNAKLPVVAYNITVVGVTRPFKLVYGSESGAQGNHKFSLEGGEIQAGVGNGGAENNITGSYVRQKQDSGQGPYRPLTNGTIIMQKNQPDGGFEIGILPMEGYSAPTITIKNNGKTLSQGTDYTLSGPKIDSQGRYVYTYTPKTIQTGAIWNLEVTAQPIDFQVKYVSHTGGEISSSSPLKLNFGGTESALVNLYQENISGSYFDGYEMTVGGVVITNNGNDKWQPGDIMTLRDIYQQARDKQAFIGDSKQYDIKLTAKVTSSPVTWGTIRWTLYKQTQWFDANDIYDSRNFNDTTTGSVRGRLGGTLKLVGYNNSFTDNGTTYLLNTEDSTTGDILIPAANAGFVDGMSLGQFYYLRTATAKIVVPDDLASDLADVVTDIESWNEANADKLYTGADINQTIDLSGITLPETISQGRQLLGWRIVKEGESGNTEEFKVYNYEISAATSSDKSSTLDLNDLGRTAGDGAKAGRDAWNAVFGTGTTAGTGKVVLIPYYDTGGKVVSNPDDDETTELKMPDTLNTYTNGSADPNGTGSISMNAKFYYTGSREAALISSNLRFAVVKRELQRNAATGDIDTGAGEAGMVAKVVAYGEINPDNTATPVILSGVYNTNQKIGLGGTDEKGWEEDKAESSFTLKLLLQNNITYQWDHKSVYSIHVWNDNNDSGLYSKITGNGGWGADTTYEAARQQGILAAFGTVPVTPDTTLNVPGVSYEVNILPRGIQSTGDTDYSIVSGQQIQWKNSEDGSSRSFDVEFKFDNTVPWSVQKKTLGQTDTATEESKKDPYYIRVVVVKKGPTENGWSRVQRLNQDGTFGNGQINDYTISLLGPGDAGYAGQDDRFLVRVTADNNRMATSSTTFGTDFAVAAYNNQNGKTDPGTGNSVLMSQIVGDYISNPNTKSVVGVSVPSVERETIIYPKGVQVYNSGTGLPTLQISQEVTKNNNQVSSEYSAEFTYDNISTGSNSSMDDMYSTTGGNYFIGFYKSTGNGDSWEMADRLEGTDDTADGEYITGVSVDNQTGRVTVKYKIPAVDNSSTTQYRLVAFYGNIDGNNNIKNITLQDAMTNANNLAMVNITLNNTTYNRIESFVYNNGGHWNSQTKETPNVVTNNNGQDLKLQAQFRYDLDSYEKIMSYWREYQNNGTPTTDDGMGYYLNWAMYGYNLTTGVKTTWLIREQVQSGLGINQSDITVSLDLKQEDSSAGTESDNLGLATITVTIQSDAVTYNNLDNQILYLFAWNQASNDSIGANYKALRHDAAASEGQSPYSGILSTILDKENPTPHWGLSPQNGSMSSTRFVANAYWFIQVRPTEVKGVKGSIENNDVQQTVTINNDGTVTEIVTAQFKRDVTVPWNVQYGNGNVNAVQPDASNARDVIRVVAYRQDYGRTGLWKRVQRLNPDTTYGTIDPNDNSYNLTIEDTDSASGIFTVKLTRTIPLNASYESYGSKYMIAAYNYDNYNGNMSDFLSSTGAVDTYWYPMAYQEFGTDIPINTTTVNFNPKSMTNVGNTPSEGTGHTFTISKKTNGETTGTFTFSGDAASWTNADSLSNEEMENQFSPQKGNVIFSLWKRDSNSGNFTFIDSYTNGVTDDPADSAADDYIKSVTRKEDSTGEISVEIHIGTRSNINNSEYRIYAWYVSSNGDGTWDSSKIKDPAFAAGDAVDLNGDIPYSTATLKLDLEEADFYIEIPATVQLYDDLGNVKDGDTDLSDNYAGNSSSISYKSSFGSDITIPEIDVYLTDNMVMKDAATDIAKPGQTVGIYYMDGEENLNIDGTSGTVKLGRLSKTAPADPDANPPVGETLNFYLNTQKALGGTQDILYEATLHFHFVVDPDNEIVTTP